MQLKKELETNPKLAIPPIGTRSLPVRKERNLLFRVTENDESESYSLKFKRKCISTTNILETTLDLPKTNSQQDDHHRTSLYILCGYVVPINHLYQWIRK